MDLKRIEKKLRDNPCVWDTTSMDYRNKNLQEKVWEEIAEFVYGDKWKSFSLITKYRKLTQLKQKTAKLKRKLRIEAEEADGRRTRDDTDGSTAGPSGIQQNGNSTTQKDSGNREDEAKNLLLSLLPTYKLLTTEQQINLNAKMLRSLSGQLNSSTRS